YVKTLARIESLRLTRLCPGHGDVIDEPRARVQDYLAHRRRREAQILELLKGGPLRITELVAVIYADEALVPALEQAAGWQVHAHLLKLKREGKVVGTSVKSVWKLA